MKHTILLADDSVTIQKVVELTFLDEDVKVISVGNGSDALARLEEVQPDLVLADVHMPGADGYEVCATAKRVLPGVPVMLLVGTFEIFDAERSAEVGAVGHMKKPFDSQELLRRVRELLAEGRSSVPAPAPKVELAAAPPVWEAEAPSWEPEPAEPAVEVAAEGEEASSWSFEPVSDGEPAAAEPESKPEESWSPFGTTRFEAPASLAESQPELRPTLEAPASALLAPAPVAVPLAVAVPATNASSGPLALSEADLEKLARRVAELLSERAVKDVAWEVVPDLAEVLLKARIRELEAAVE